MTFHQAASRHAFIGRAAVLELGELPYRKFEPSLGCVLDYGPS
jgi:hypothetical protein